MASRGHFELSYESLNTIFLIWNVNEDTKENRCAWSHHTSCPVLSYPMSFEHGSM